MKDSKALCAKLSDRGFASVFLLVIFLFFYLLMLCAPFTYDDYIFAGLSFSSPMEVFQFCLRYGNGRLLGNLGAIFFVNAPVICALAKAFVLSGTVFLIPAVLGIRNRHALALSFLLVTTINPELFAQVFTWTSGFQNYVPPVFLMLSIVYLIQRYPSQSDRSYRKALICFGVFLLGFLAQLYVEHSSLIHIALAAFVTLKALKDPDHRGLLPSLLFLISAVLGLLTMFWIPMHFYTEQNYTDGYRSLHFQGIQDLILCCVRNALRLSNHYFGTIGIPVFAGAAITIRLTQNNRSEKANSVLYSLCLIPAAYIVLCILFSCIGWYAELAIIHHVLAMLAVFSVLLVWFVALFGMQDLNLRNKILTLLGFAVFSLLPLLVVTPIRIRVVYHSQIFTVLAFVLCFYRWISTWQQNWISHLSKAFWTTTILMALMLGSVFFSINAMDNARDQYIRQGIANGAEQVDIFRIPYDYVHDYTDHSMGEYYYREERFDVGFNIMDYDQWTNDYLDTVN